MSKVERAKYRIASGHYDRPEVVDKTVNAVLPVLAFDRADPPLRRCKCGTVTTNPSGLCMHCYDCAERGAIDPQAMGVSRDAQFAAWCVTVPIVLGAVFEIGLGVSCLWKML